MKLPMATCSGVAEIIRMSSGELNMHKIWESLHGKRLSAANPLQSCGWSVGHVNEPHFRKS